MLLGEYLFRTKNVIRLEDRSEGSTANAEIAAAIGPPSTPATIRMDIEISKVGI